MARSTRTRGAPGGLNGHTWGERRGALEAPALAGTCPRCGRALVYRPRSSGRFLVPGSAELRCPDEECADPVDGAGARD